MNSFASPVALITGGAKRIGAEITKQLHVAGFNVVVHYHESADTAKQLTTQLNQQRNNSAICIKANLNNHVDIKLLVESSLSEWNRINLLVNNASTFYPTPVDSVTEQDWNDLINVNVKAPYFLSTFLADELKKTQGCIVNIADIYAAHPLKNYSIYSIAKAGNVMLTKSLAQELAPNVRVNAIAPGAILWPSNTNLSEEELKKRLAKIPLQKTGEPYDIARTLLFLVKEAPYMTGQILTVDGGRSITS
jgi:pteridine reductase